MLRPKRSEKFRLGTRGCGYRRCSDEEAKMAVEVHQGSTQPDQAQPAVRGLELGQHRKDPWGRNQQELGRYPGPC